MDDQEYNIMPRAERAMRIIEETERRVTTIETKMTRVETQVEVLQTSNARFILIQDKQDTLIDLLSRQATVSEANHIALKDFVVSQTQAFTAHTAAMEKLQEKFQKELVDSGKLQERLQTQMNIVTWVGSGIASLVLAYLFSLLVK